MADPVHVARGKLATSVRMGRTEGEIEARHELTEAKLERASKEALMNDFPPRSEAIDRICELLRSGAA